MRKLVTICILFAAGLLLIGCCGPSADEARVTGTVNYLQRIAPRKMLW